MPDNKLKKLHEVLVSKGIDNKSFEEFSSNFSNNEEKQRKLHDVLVSRGVDNKSFEEFQSNFFFQKTESLGTSQEVDTESTTGMETTPGSLDSSEVDQSKIATVERDQEPFNLLGIETENTLVQEYDPTKYLQDDFDYLNTIEPESGAFESAMSMRGRLMNRSQRKIDPKLKEKILSDYNIKKSLENDIITEDDIDNALKGSKGSIKKLQKLSVKTPEEYRRLISEGDLNNPYTYETKSELVEYVAPEGEVERKEAIRSKFEAYNKETERLRKDNPEATGEELSAIINRPDDPNFITDEEYELLEDDYTPTGFEGSDLSKMYDVQELNKVEGLNIKDFDGYLTSQGYKEEFFRLLNDETISEDGRGYDVSGNYNPSLAAERIKLEFLTNYINNQVERNVESQILKYQLENDGRHPSLDGVKISFSSGVNDKKLSEYIEKDLPTITSKLKQRDVSNEELYQDMKNGEVKAVGQAFKQGWRSIVDRINSFSAGTYDFIGMDSVADEIRMNQSQIELEREDFMRYTYASGKEADVNGTTYLVDEKGQVYDKDLGLRVTNVLTPSELENIQKEVSTKGEKSSTFSGAGMAIQGTGIASDMLFQIALTKGVSNIGSGIGAGLSLTDKGSKVLSLMSKIPMKATTASSMIAQGTLFSTNLAEQSYRQALDAGMSIEQAEEIQSIAGSQGLALGVITAPLSTQNYAMSKIFGKSSDDIAQGALKAYEKGGAEGATAYWTKILQKGKLLLSEGGKETFQENVQLSGETFVIGENVNEFAKKEIMANTISGDEFINTTILSAASGFFMPLAGSLSSNVKTKFNERFRPGYAAIDRMTALYELSKDVDKTKSLLNSQVNKKIYTEEQVNKILSDIDVFRNTINSIPKNLSPETALNVMRDLGKIKKQEQLKSELDPAFHANIDEKIQGLRNDIIKKTNFDYLNKRTKLMLKDEAIRELSQEAEERGEKDFTIDDSQATFRAIENFSKLSIKEQRLLAEIKAEEETEVRQPDVQEKTLITPENSSNYANMTEDGEGNFVFFHKGKKGYETIKVGTGQSSVTSREEASAIGKVGGLAMYYTDKNSSERQGSKEVQYAVTVPIDKVYDFNTDPLQLIDEARKMHTDEFPGKAFDKNTQLAYVTKIAGERGFDMVVAEWNDMTRAQSTKELTPIDTQELNGNTVTKDFDKTYKSNKDKGFKPVIPESKYSVLQKVYDAIYKSRNNEQKYDELYRLRQYPEKYTQEEITDLIENSDLSEDLKQQYRDALDFKEEKRRSIDSNNDSVFTDKTAMPNAPKGVFLDIEMVAGKNGREMSEKEVLDALPFDTVEVDNDGKNLRIKIPRELSSTEMMSLMKSTEQEAIGQVVDGMGTLYAQNEKLRKDYGDAFNPNFFKLPREGQLKTQSRLSNKESGNLKDFFNDKQKPTIKEVVDKSYELDVSNIDTNQYLSELGYTKDQIAEFREKQEGIYKKSGNIVLDWVNKTRRYLASARAFLPKGVFLAKENKEAAIETEIGLAERSAKRLNKALKNQPDSVYDEVNKLMRGERFDLPRNIAMLAKEMRLHIDSLSEKLIESGAIKSSESMENIRKNLGSYLNRSFKMFDDKNWSKIVPEKIVNQAREFIKNSWYQTEYKFENAKKEAEENNMTVDEWINEKTDQEIAEILNKDEANSFISAAIDGSKNMKVLKQRKDIPAEIRALMGEYNDPAYNYVVSVAKIVNIIENQKYLEKIKDLGEGVFLFKEEQLKRGDAKNYVRISAESNESLAPLNGYFAPKEFVDQIRRDDLINIKNSWLKSIYKGWLKGVGFVKKMKTIYSIGTHGKNVFGNARFMAQNGYLNPKDYNDAFNLLRNEFKSKGEEALSKKLDEYKKAGIIGQSVQLSEIRSMFKDGDSFDIRIEKRLAENTDSKAKKAGRLAKKGAKKVDQFLQDVYQAEDDLFKIVAYENEKRDYADIMFDKKYDELNENEKRQVVDKVSNIVKNILPNYGRVGGLAKGLKAVPVAGTFISFQLESYRTAWNTVNLAVNEIKSDNSKLRNKGAKRLASIILVEGIKQSLLYLLGTTFLDDDDEERIKANDVKPFLPEWAKNSDIIVAENEPGKFTYLNLSASDPFGSISQILNAGVRGENFSDSVTGMMKEFADPVTSQDILLSAIDDVVRNQNSYGGNLYDDTDTFFEKSEKTTLRLYKALEPGTLTSIRKIAKKDKPSDMIYETVGQFTGLKPIEVDVNKIMNYRMNDIKESISNIKKEGYKAEYESMEKGSIEGLFEAYENVDNRLKPVYEEANKITNKAMRLGVSIMEIDNILTSKRFSNDDASMILFYDNLKGSL